MCVDGSPTTIEALKCAAGSAAKRRRLDAFRARSARVYDSYKRIFGEDLERIEELFDGVDSKKEAAKRIFVLPLCQHARERGFTAKAVVQEGAAAGEILAELQEGGYDLAMLAHKKSPSASWRLFGVLWQRLFRTPTRV